MPERSTKIADARAELRTAAAELNAAIGAAIEDYRPAAVLDRVVTPKRIVIAAAAAGGTLVLLLAVRRLFR